MSKKVTLVFDAPGRWDSTWLEEVVNGKLRVTEIRKGDVLEADLEDGSLRSAQLKKHMEHQTCRIVKESRPPVKGAHKEDR